MVRFGASHAVGSYYYPVLAVISTGLMACPLAHPTNSSTAHCSCCSIIEKIRRRRIFLFFVREKNKKDAGGHQQKTFGIGAKTKKNPSKPTCNIRIK
jgi:hypothetical protein